MRSLSPFSDPIQAGINTFKEVSGVLQSYDDREMEKQRFNEDIKDKATLRQARELDIAEKKRRADEEEANKPLLEQDRKVRMQELTKKSQDLLTEPVKNNFVSGIQKLSNGNGDLTDDELTAQAIAVDQSYDLNKMTPQEIDEYGKNIRYLRNYMTQISPLIQEQLKKGGGTLTRSAMPKVFNAIDKMPFLGGDINKGTANDGQSAKNKKLDSIIISPDPSGQFMGMMTFKLQVENQKGDTYYAPLTPGRSGDPNEQVLQIPIELFAANVEQRAKFAEAQEPIIKKYGFDGYAKILADGKREHKTMQAYASGSDAVDALLKENPKADANTIRTRAMKSILDKAKELGVAIDPAKMKAFVGEWIDEKKQGDTDAPEIKLAKQYKQLSPEDKKAFKEVQEAKKEKPLSAASNVGPMDQNDFQREGMKYNLTGKLPFTGMGGAGKKEMIHAGNQYAKEQGWTPQMVLRMQADYKSMDKSLTAQRKNYDAMNGFVINMDKQMDRLEAVYKKLPRSQYRLLNIPIVELKTKAQGSGEEASAAAILIELGNESGKLSTNSASSVRELSEGAQKQWAKIHDNKLSFNELKKVLETTRGLGHDRLNSTKAAMDFTLQGIESLGEDSANKPKGRELSSQSQGQPNNDAIEAIKKIAKGNGPDAERAKKFLKKNGIQY